MALVGRESTRLIVLRGNSASCKSATAQRIRQRYGRGIAIVGQDNIRRVILKERDEPGAANIGLLDTIARYTLDHGYHAIVEGILDAGRYGEMLAALRQDHRGTSHFFYFDVSFEETLRRHGSKPEASEYGEREMREWYRQLDLLPAVSEHRVAENTTLDNAVEMVMIESGLIDDSSWLRGSPT